MDFFIFYNSIIIEICCGRCYNKNMEINVEEILNKILSQTEVGKVEIGEEEFGKWTYYVKLLNENSKTNKGELSLKIHNKQELIQNLKEYLTYAIKFYEKDKFYYDLSEKSLYEKLVLDLLVNATNYDFNNIEAYVKQRTEMLKEDLTQNEMLGEHIVVGEYLNADILIKITKNTSNLEGPYKFGVMFDNNFDSFNLPSVTFGKIKDEVFIYCLQGER